MITLALVSGSMLGSRYGLLARPQVLLRDKPSLGLAPALIDALFRIAADLRDECVTLLRVDPMAALAVADRGDVIESGSIVHQTLPATLGTAATTRMSRLVPRNPVVASPPSPPTPLPAGEGSFVCPLMRAGFRGSGVSPAGGCPHDRSQRERRMTPWI